VSSEQDYGKMRNLMKGKGAWHTRSLSKAKAARVPSDSIVEYVTVDFGGEGDEIYEIDYIWLRNDHSSAYSIEYKDPESSWQLLVPWTSCEPYEFITIKDVHVQAAELKLSIKGSRIWDASWYDALRTAIERNASARKVCPSASRGLARRRRRCCCCCSSAAEAGKREGCRGETPRTPPAAGEVAHVLGRGEVSVCGGSGQATPRP
jgi:hypothetical protein